MEILVTKKEEPTFERDDEVMVRDEKLGKYFSHHNIETRFHITFPQFVDKVNRGVWESYITERQSPVGRVVCG